MNFIQIIKENPLTMVTILVISSLFMVPVSASTIADLELVSTKHDFGPGIGGIESKEQTIFLPETGWLTITYQTEPYLGDTKGGPDFFPKDLGSYYLGQPGEKTDTPPKWVKGQPGKYVIKSYINTPQGDRPYTVKLVAPWQCQAYQICNAGTVYAAKQRLTYEFTPDSKATPAPSQSYPDGTLLKGSGQNVYVIENGVRRWIPDPETFNSMGYNWNAIKVISDSDLSSIPKGTDLPMANDRNANSIPKPTTADDYSKGTQMIPGGIPKTGLIAYYSFNDGTALDDSGNGNDGQLKGGATIVLGKIGKAVSFDGISGSVDTLSGQSFNTGDQVAISFWTKPDANNAMDKCCQGLVTTDYYGIEISGGTDPRIGVNFFANTEGPSFYHTSDAIGGGSPVSPGQWHHVASVYDGSKMRLYIDGLLVAERDQSGSLKSMAPTSFLSIGSEDGRTSYPGLIGTRYFNGLIDEVAIYNRALSVDEVASVSQASLISSPSAPD